MSKLMKLHEAEVNSKVRVVKIDPESRLRRRIMDMGITRGTEIAE